MYRGARGECACYRKLGINTAQRTGRGILNDSGIRIEKTVEIRRPAMELYHFWHHLPNLSDIMPHLKEVTLEGTQSHWVVTGPAGHDVQWDAEFINEKPGEIIAWQSLPDSEVQNAGSVRFNSIEDGGATRLTVALEYLPPAGKLGAIVASLFGASPETELESDLGKFKEKMEAAS